MANDGHVIDFPLAIEEAGKRPVGLRARRVGIGEATTFPGFCQSHDNELFSCLETEVFSASPRQLAGLVYRSVSQEICIKHQMLQCNLPGAFSKDSPDFLAEKASGEFRLYLELRRRKLRIEEMLRSDKYALESCVVRFAGPPTFLVATTFLPYVTFTGRSLERRMEWVTLTVMPDGNGGVAVFSWDKACPKNGSLLLKSLRSVPSNLITNCILNLALEVSENLALSPAWWDSLSSVQRAKMLERSGRGTFTDTPPPANILRPTNAVSIDWSVREMKFI